MTLHRHCDGPACDSHQRTNSALKQDWLELRVIATEVTEDYCSVQCLLRKHAHPNLTIGPSL